MRSIFLSLLALVSFLGATLPASAQQLGSAAQPATDRIALATPAAAGASAAPRVACSRLDGQVLGADGKPLVGATVTVRGTQHLCITNSEGRYLVPVAVYQGQVLEVEAAGYTSREVPVTDCDAPTIGLELAAGTRVKKNGKRAGQIVRFGTADMQ